MLKHAGGFVRPLTLIAMRYKIKAIIPADDLGTTPARVLRKSGIVFINRNIWNKLSEPAKKFILLHEEGHHVLDTSNELKADEYAFYRYAGSEKYSLKNTLKTITQTLDTSRPDHQERIQNIINHILLFDYLNFGNEKALKMYAQINISPKLESFVKKQLVKFLQEKGIKSIKDLPIEQREALLSEFMETPTMLELTYRKTIKEAVKNIEQSENWRGRAERRRLRELRRRLKEKELELRLKDPEKWKQQRKEKLKKLGQIAKPVIGAIAGIAGAAFGVPQIGGIVGKILGGSNETKQNQPPQQMPAPAPAPSKAIQPAPAPDKPEKEEKKKDNKVIYFFGGLTVLVLVVVLMNKR